MNNYTKTSKTRRGELMCNGVSARWGRRLGFSALCTLLFTFHVLHLNADVIDSDQTWTEASSFTVGGESYSGHWEYLTTEARTYNGNITAEASNYSVVKSGAYDLNLNGTNRIYRLAVASGGINLAKKTELTKMKITYDNGAHITARGEDVSICDLSIYKGYLEVDGADVTASTSPITINGGGRIVLKSGSLKSTYDGKASYGDMSIALGSGGGGVFEMSGGSYENPLRFHIGGNNSASTGGYGVFRMTGGNVTTRQYDILGNGATATGEVYVTGGTYTKANGNFRVGRDGSGYLEIAGTGVMDMGNYDLYVAQNSASGMGRVVLGPGGTLKAKAVTGGTGTSEFLFNGGTLKAGVAATAVSGLTTLSVSELGGIVDTDGKSLTLSSAISPAMHLLHRWSFNGDLTDSAGGQTATLYGATLNNNGTVSVASTAAANRVDLGSGVFPTDGSPVTVEVWAKQNNANQAYSGLFYFGAADEATYATMLWTTDSGTPANRINTDRVQVRVNSSDNNNLVANGLAPYTLGTEFHIAFVCQPFVNKAWQVTAYKQDATTGETISKAVFEVANGWSPTIVAAEACYLGNRGNKQRPANASYNEVRIWNRALTEAELTLSALAGPDALPNEAFVKRGVGTLTLTGANVYANSTRVEAGTLALASGATLPAGNRVEIAPGATLSFAGQGITSGTLVFNATASGVGTLVNTSGALDLSNLSLEVSGLDALPGRKYRIATSSGGFTGTFANATFLPRCSWKVSYEPDGVYIEKQGLMVIVH